MPSSIPEALPTLFREEFEDEIPPNIKCHLNIIKWVGVLLILSTCTVPVIIMVSTTHCPPKDYEVKPNLNQTACVYVKQYHLRHNTYATVCNLDGHIFVDIRRFINGTGSAIGIQLESNQWLRLKQMTPSIDQGISEARTYWNTLKNL